VLTPHEGLVVLAESRVDVSPTPPPAEPVGWDVLRDPATADRMCEQLDATPVTEPAPDLLHDRSVFEQRPLSETFANARDVRVYAPSAVNLLSAETCDVLRRTVLARRNGSVRVVVLDPEEKDALRLAARQLDDSVEFPVQRLPASLESTLERLELMSRWTTNGSFEYRLLPYNPGFSLVLLDPETSHGRAIVEIHGFHNTATPARMHLELTRDTSERWYAYWVEQFDHIWEAARSPLTPSG